MWARWADTSRVSFVSRTLCTTGDSCEQTTYGPRHGSSSFGLGPSASWYGLYTSTSCPGLNTGYGLSLLLFSACLSARPARFRRASSKVICKLSRVFCANSSVSAVLPTYLVHVMRNSENYIDWKSRLSPEH